MSGAGAGGWEGMGGNGRFFYKDFLNCFETYPALRRAPLGLFSPFRKGRLPHHNYLYNNWLHIEWRGLSNTWLYRRGLGRGGGLRIFIKEGSDSHPSPEKHYY